MNDTTRRSAADARQALLRVLVRTAFNAAPEPIYRLASGAMSRYYVDCRMAMSHAEAREAVGELMADRIESGRFGEIDAVGGLVIGAYPVSIALADALYRRAGCAPRVFIVRKEAKKHGLGKFVEGDVEKGMRAVVVDDVITSGGSTIQAIERARDWGLEIAGALAIVDRGESGGREAIEAVGIPFESLLALSELAEAAR
jgi:orotate phosphoribosyltransferase